MQVKVCLLPGDMRAVGWSPKRDVMLTIGNCVTHTRRPQAIALRTASSNVQPQLPRFCPDQHARPSRPPSGGSSRNPRTRSPDWQSHCLYRTAMLTLARNLLSTPPCPPTPFYASPDLSPVEYRDSARGRTESESAIMFRQLRSPLYGRF